MATSLPAAITQKTAQGVVQGVEVAAPIATEHVKKEAKGWLRSKATTANGFITGGLLLGLLYGMEARRRRLLRIEKKLAKLDTLDVVVETVAGDVPRR